MKYGVEKRKERREGEGERRKAKGQVNLKRR